MKDNKLSLTLLGIALGVATSVSGCGGGGGSSDGGAPDTSSEFAFATEGPEAFKVIDRHGAVEAGTVGIAAAAGLGIAPVRDAYNASNPAEDAQGMWLGEIAKSVADLHATLDDDLIALGLVPASQEVSLAQAGPVLVPDTIKYNPDLPTSYPNGRNLEDQVVDITIAAALLDLNTPGQSVGTFAELPLNPPTNDVPFKAEFPYLADPHIP